jgi:uncharacterized membrane protein YkoI
MLRKLVLAAGGLLALGGTLTTGIVLAQEQDDVFRAVRSGAILPLDQIERMVRPQVGGAELIGQDFDPQSMTYRLRYQTQSGQVFDVRVDARSGQIRR